MARKLTAIDVLPSEDDFKNCGVPYVASRRAGYADSTPGESGYKYAIYSIAAVEKEYGPVNDETIDVIACNLTGWAQSWNGAGRGFAGEPVIRIFKRNFIVKQFTGLDI
jgi:hypothetical protein